MKTSTILVVIIAIFIVAGGAWWYMQTNTPTPTTNTDTNVDITTNTPSTTTTSTTTNATSSQSGTSSGVSAGVGAAVGTTPKTVTVTYSSSGGFSPKSITINKGDTVTFVSQSGQMWVGADEHPSHTGYDGTSRQEHCTGGPSTTSFDQCSVGSSYSFTFNKTGTFDYHNHVGSAQVGTVIVK